MVHTHLLGPRHCLQPHGSTRSKRPTWAFSEFRVHVPSLEIKFSGRTYRLPSKPSWAYFHSFLQNFWYRSVHNGLNSCRTPRNLRLLQKLLGHLFHQSPSIPIWAMIPHPIRRDRQWMLGNLIMVCHWNVASRIPWRFEVRSTDRFAPKSPGPILVDRRLYPAAGVVTRCHEVIRGRPIQPRGGTSRASAGLLSSLS